MMCIECSWLDPSYQSHITFTCTGCYQLHPHHRLGIINVDILDILDIAYILDILDIIDILHILDVLDNLDIVHIFDISDI